MTEKLGGAFMIDWSELFLKKGKCCICGNPLKGSKYVNMINLDKYATWKTPSWRNIRAKDPEKQSGRAVAIACDHCVDSTAKAKGAIKYVIELEVISGDINIKYHKVEDLKDAPEIKLEDLRI